MYGFQVGDTVEVRLSASWRPATVVRCIDADVTVILSEGTKLTFSAYDPALRHATGELEHSGHSCW